MNSVWVQKLIACITTKTFSYHLEYSNLGSFSKKPLHLNKYSMKEICSAINLTISSTLEEETVCNVVITKLASLRISHQYHFCERFHLSKLS